MLLFTTLVSFAGAEETTGWVYDADAKTDSNVWTYLFSADEAFYDGYIYVPKMLLASDGEMEAWLVAYSVQAEDASEPVPVNGYLVMYIQLAPFPKIIGTYSVGDAPEETEPSCEIKLLLDSSQALGEDHLLSESLREQFHTGEEYMAITAIYLDTPARDYLAAGWANRIRVKEGKRKFTLTYKIRYPVQGSDVETALAAARADGFSLFDEQFTAELDWGYSKMTLSFSADIDVKTKETADISLLSRDEAVQMLSEHMPSEEANWVTADLETKNAEAMQMAGPITFLRYTGTLDGQSVQIEIWPLPGTDGIQYVVELSRSCDSLEEAAGLRDGIIETLDRMGILMHEDALKTELILNGLDKTAE